VPPWAPMLLDGILSRLIKRIYSKKRRSFRRACNVPHVEERWFLTFWNPYVRCVRRSNSSSLALNTPSGKVSLTFEVLQFQYLHLLNKLPWRLQQNGGMKQCQGVSSHREREAVVGSLATSECSRRRPSYLSSC
jgi:hypothetical protein